MVIRADASSRIGSGHVMRCLAIANEMHQNGWSVFLATPPETTIVMSKFLPDFVKVVIIPEDQSNNPDALRTALPGGCNFLLIDHYGLNHAYLKSLRNWADRIAVIDDLANRNYDADILIDQTLGRESADYSDRVPNSCILLTGPGYALLRPEFSEIRMKRQKQRSNLSRPWIYLYQWEPQMPWASPGTSSVG